MTLPVPQRESGLPRSFQVRHLGGRRQSTRQYATSVLPCVSYRAILYGARDYASMPMLIELKLVRSDALRICGSLEKWYKSTLTGNPRLSCSPSSTETWVHVDFAIISRLKLLKRNSIYHELYTVQLSECGHESRQIQRPSCKTSSLPTLGKYDQIHPLSGEYPTDRKLCCPLPRDP